MRFLHTADWQIGMACRFAGDKAAQIREARLTTAARIVDVANAREVDFILIAGDLFDMLAPRSGDISRVCDILSRARMTVYVLPGNHDPAGDAGPYGSAVWLKQVPKNVITIVEPQAFEIPDGVLLATPSKAKYGSEDPTAWFGQHESDPSLIRVGIAHGSLQIGEIAKTHRGDTRAPFPIAADAAERGRLDYLALGDWHSAFVVSSGTRTMCYSGTPEPTSFGEPDSGLIAIVSIDSPGSQAQIERQNVGSLTWYDEVYDVSNEASITSMHHELLDIRDPKSAIVKVDARGLCTPAASEQLRGYEAVYADRFLHFTLKHTYSQRPEDRAAWLAFFPDGEFRTIATELLDQIESGEDGALATRALDILAECAK